MSVVVTRSLPETVRVVEGNSLAVFVSTNGTMYVRDANGVTEPISTYVSGGGSSMATVPTGGTGVTTYATGDILYAGGAAPGITALSRLAAVEGGFLKIVGGIPTYSTSISLTVGTTTISSGTIGRVLFQGTGNVLQQSNSLFWDNTNSTLAIGGTSTLPTDRVTITGIGNSSSTSPFFIQNSDEFEIFRVNDDRTIMHTVSNANATAQYTFQKGNGSAGIVLSNSATHGVIDGLVSGQLKIGALLATTNIEIGLNGTTGARIAFVDTTSQTISGAKSQVLFGQGSNYTAVGTGGSVTWTKWVGTLSSAVNDSAFLLNITPTITASAGTLTLLDYNPLVTSITGAHYGLRLRPVTKNAFGLSSAPTAQIHISANTTGTANLVPLKFSTGGALVVTPEAQAIETTDTSIYWTNTAANRLEFVLPANTLTLSNKRVTRRAGTSGSGVAEPAINTNNVDFVRIDGLTVNITSFSTNLSGAPNDGDELEIIITGTASRLLTWGASFASTTVTLPTTTVNTDTLRVYLEYSTINNLWNCVRTA